MEVYHESSAGDLISLRDGGLFRNLSRCSIRGLDTVRNTAGCMHKASDRELRSALYVRTTQVTRYSSPEENRQRAVFQVYAAPAICVYCHVGK
jgi:hypothetical protein